MRLSTQSLNTDAVVLSTSRAGSRYASYAGLHLNSPYDPVREATRFLDSHAGSPTTSTFLILGDTLPYLRGELQRRFPTAAVVSIYFHRDFPFVMGEGAGRLDRRDYWSPAGREGLRDYLVRRLSPGDLEGISVLQWPPAMRAFPALAEQAARLVEQIVREGTAERVTSTAFARAWTHNLFTNYLSIDRWHLLAPHSKPVLIAASGPSLARAMPAIRRHRHRLVLLALPSSLEALAAADLTPDLLVTVDAGYWAQLHLRALDPRAATPVALPLIASRGVWRSSARPVVLSAGSFVERELFRRARLAPFEILATATVGATALELASRWTDGPLVVAGLDLCYDRLEEHVRPHSFDTHFEATATRLTTHLAVVAGRLLRLGLSRPSGSPAVTPALKTYADWFRGWNGSGRVYRLFPSSVPIEGFTSLHDLTALLAGSSVDSPPPAPLPAPTPPLAERRETLSLLLDSWNSALESTARRGAVTASQGIATDDPTPFELLDTLAPRACLRYRQGLRTDPHRAPVLLDELIEEARGEIGDMRRRFLP